MSLQATLLLPVAGMVFLTVGIALWMLKLRYKAVLEDGVSAKYFKLNRGAKLPEYLVRVTQHYENLFETPVLFYVAILLILVLEINDIKIEGFESIEKITNAAISLSFLSKDKNAKAVINGEGTGEIIYNLDLNYMTTYISNGILNMEIEIGNLILISKNLTSSSIVTTIL